MSTAQAEATQQHGGVPQNPQLSVLDAFVMSLDSVVDKQKFYWGNGSSLLLSGYKARNIAVTLIVQAKGPHQSSAGILELSAEGLYFTNGQRGWQYGMAGTEIGE